MPEIPTVQLRQQAPRQRLPDVGPGAGAYVARGLGVLAEAGDYISRVQDVYEKSEARRHASDHLQSVKDEIALADAEANDPDEFRERGNTAISNSRAAIEAIPNKRIKGLTNENISSALKSAQNVIEIGAVKKSRDKIKGNFINEEKEFLARAVGGDSKAIKEYDARVDELVAANVIEYTVGSAKKLQLPKDVRKGRTEYFATGLQDELDNLQNQAFRQPGKAAELFEQGKKRIQDAGGDWLEPGKIDDASKKFRDVLYAGAVKGMIQENPEGTKTVLKSGAYDNKLSNQSLIALTSEADTEIDRRRREAEARRKEGERLIGKEVDDFKIAVMNGFQWAGNVAQLRDRVRGTEHEREFAETIRDSSELSIFSQMGPFQQERYLRVKGTAPKTGSEAQLYNKLQTAHERTKTELAKDPLTYAIRQRAIPDLMPLDINNPTSLKERSIAAGIVEQRYGVPVSPLSDDEATSVLSSLQKAPADQRAQVMRQFTQSFTPRQVQSLAAKIDKKGAGEMAQAFGMSSQVPEVTSRILQGMDAKRANKEVLPQGKDMKDMDEAIIKKLGEAYKADPTALDSVRDAVKSYYAWGRWEVGDLTAKLDDKALNRAIYAVSGGVMDFNGAQTLPPRYGVTETQMREMIKGADFRNVMGDIKPDSVLRYGKLTAVGPGLYRVTIGGSPVFDKNNKPFTLDLSR